MKKVTIVIIIILLHLSHLNSFNTVHAAKCDWLMHMNGPEHTGSAAYDCAPSSKNFQKLWEFNANGKIYSSSSIKDGLMYFGTASNMFYCVDINTGIKKWEYNLGESCKNSKGDSIGGTISTPAIYYGKIYFGTVCGSVICLNEKTGLKEWEFSNSYKAESFNSSITVANSKVYCVSTDSWIYCLDANSGSQIWKSVVLENQNSSPCYYDNKIYVAGWKFFNCLDASNGKELWDYWYQGEKILSCEPCISDNKVFFGTADSEICSFYASDGKKNWQKEYPKCITGISSDQSCIYFGGLDKKIYSLRKSDGSTKWSFSLDDYPIAAPIVGESMIYASTMSGNFYVIDAQTGTSVYSYKTGGSIWSAASIYDKRVFVGSFDGKIYCFSSDQLKAPLSRIEINPPSSFIKITESIQFSATGIDSEGKNLGINPKWTVSPSNMGTISYYGKFTAGAKGGRCTIKACVDDICGEAYVEILEPQVVSRIEIYPKEHTMIVGETKQFEATAYDQNDNLINDIKFDWYLDDNSIGSIFGNGLFSANAKGSCNIIAKSGSVVGRASIIVEGIESIEIDPSLILVKKGQFYQLSVFGITESGKRIKIDNSMKWSLNPPNQGEISEKGLFVAPNYPGLRGFVICDYMGITAKAEYRVEDERKAKIVLSSNLLDFGEIPEKQTKTMKLFIKNSGDAEALVNISSNSNYLSFEQNNFKVAIGETREAIIIADSSKLTPNEYKGIILFKCATDEISLEYKLKVINKPSNCPLLMPSDFFFGLVKRGKTMTLPFSLDFPNTGIYKGSVKTNSSWVEVSPSTFTINGNRFEGTVTVKSSAMSKGTDFEGELVFEIDGCSPIKAKVKVRTESNITIKLVLGNKKGILNDSDVELDVPPQSIGGRTLIPIRFVSECFGCKVEWQSSEGKITISRNSFEIVIWKDKKEALVNGQMVKLDIPASIISGRTLVPLRFISESFGAKVNWDPKTKGITINWDPL